MGDICRTCLRTQDYLLDLYENRELIFKIESIVSIEIQEEPFFPSKICYECVGNITNSFNFNKVLINSFNELNKQYEIHQKTKAGEKEVEEECNENIKVEPVDFKQENAILDHTDIIKDEADNTEIEHKEIKSSEPIKCNVCLKTFKKLESLRYHRQRHSGKIFTCELCGQCFNVKRSYIKHVKTHAEKLKIIKIQKLSRFEEPIECDICSKMFKSSKSLENHKLIHMGIIFTCEICGKCFKVETEYSEHVKTHTGPEIGKATCSVCRKVKEIDISKIYRYNLSHTGTHPYKCKVCMKGFTSPPALKINIRQRFSKFFDGGDPKNDVI